MIRIVGIDPGLVDTGVVSLTLDRDQKRTLVSHRLFHGYKPTTVSDIQDYLGEDYNHLFIEEYRPRSHFQEDTRMIEYVQLLRKLWRAQVINNTGSKKVIKPALLRLLHLDDFPRSNHADLEAAARILVYGALKDPVLNELIARVINDRYAGIPWRAVP